MTYATVRRATRAAKAAAVILTAVSCSVYDESLLGSGSAEGGHGGTNSTAGSPGAAGEGTAGNGGAAAGAANGGSSGSSSGDAGMMDNAGAMEAGGETSEGGGAGSSGSAGSAGTGGTAGSSAGTGGGTVTAGSGGTTAGSGGTAGSAGSGGAPVTGCAKLSVPIDQTTDAAHFVISLPSAIDLSSATTGIISMHLYVQAGAAGTIFNYVQDSQYHYFGVTTAMRPLLKSQSGWVTLPFNVGAQAVGSTNIVKTDIRRIGIEINAGPDTTGWSNPTVVYVDSVTVMTPALSFPFDTTTTVNTTPSGTDVSGQVLWLHNGSSDTTATGVTLAWQATCP